MMEFEVPYIAPLKPENVQSMMNDPKAPTADLDEFLAAYEEDDNAWWYISCGHHLNLFDAAIERIRELERELKERDAHQ